MERSHTPQPFHNISWAYSRHSVFFSTNVILHSNALLPIPYFVFFSWFTLVSNVLPELCELETKVSWSLMKHPNPGRPMFILWLQLPLTVTCSGHLVSFIPAAAKGLVECWFFLAQMQRTVLYSQSGNSTERKEFFLHQLPPTPYYLRTFDSSVIQEAKKYHLLTLLFSILHCREGDYKGSAI